MKTIIKNNDAKELAVFLRSQLPRIGILPIIRRVMPGLIAQELVGVQPMTAPSSMIHTMRMRYNTTVSGPKQDPKD
jgi:hypothetical protein